MLCVVVSNSAGNKHLWTNFENCYLHNGICALLAFCPKKFLVSIMMNKIEGVVVKSLGHCATWAKLSMNRFILLSFVLSLSAPSFECPPRPIVCNDLLPKKVSWILVCLIIALYHFPENLPRSPYWCLIVGDTDMAIRNNEKQVASQPLSSGEIQRVQLFLPFHTYTICHYIKNR